jgi:hypothetical protein
MRQTAHNSFRRAKKSNNFRSVFVLIDPLCKIYLPNENMGGSSSKPVKKNDPYCEDCQKDQQMPLPSRDNVSSNGKPCATLYDLVESCMKINNGQISMCQEEWGAFRKCHEANRAERR